MSLHTFGDSHSIYGFNHIDNINIHWMGPLLCYTFGKKKLDILNIRDYDVKDNDSIIFCLGEIDCRAHIHKYVNENISFQTIIDDIIENYFEAIKLNIEGYKNIKVIIYNVLPPGNVSNVHTEHEINTYILVKTKNHIPWKGSNNERMQYHLYFNQKLKEYCEKNNFIFMDIYDKYCDENGLLKKELSDGNVHISDPIYIKEFLINNNIN